MTVERSVRTCFLELADDDGPCDDERHDGDERDGGADPEETRGVRRDATSQRRRHRHDAGAAALRHASSIETGSWVCGVGGSYQKVQNGFFTKPPFP